MQEKKNEQSKKKSPLNQIKSQEKSEKSVQEKIEDLCQKIWGKPASEVKFLLVSCYVHHQLLAEELARTGLYQWVNTFDGVVHYPRDVEDYNYYDLVQINTSAQDIHLIKDVREKIDKNGNTKLVANNDYTTEMWGGAFDYLHTHERELQGADMYFGTEYFQVTALSELVNKKVYINPHPCDVKRLKSLPKKPVKPLINVIWRRYDQNAYIPSLMVRNHGFTTQLIGYDHNLDKRHHLTWTLYDYCMAGTNYFEFCDQMRESTVLVDPFTFHSYSRATVDAAALGVPVVGSNRTQSMNVCYPYTCIDPWDVKSARELISKLIHDNEFRKKVVDTAIANSEFYSVENCKLRYLEALWDSINSEDIERKTVKRIESVKGVGRDSMLLMSGGLIEDETKKQGKH